MANGEVRCPIGCLVWVVLSSSARGLTSTGFEHYPLGGRSAKCWVCYFDSLVRLGGLIVVLLSCGAFYAECHDFATLHTAFQLSILFELLLSLKSCIFQVVCHWLRSLTLANKWFCLHFYGLNL